MRRTKTKKEIQRLRKAAKITRDISAMIARHVRPGTRECEIAELIKEFMREKPGILNWMVEGWKKYQDDGLNPPDIVKIATRAYRADQDLIKGFIDEFCDTENPRARILTKDLYAAYLLWCRENNDNPLKNRTFFTKIEERGYLRRCAHYNNFKEFIGIKIKNEVREKLREVEDNKMQRKKLF